MFRFIASFVFISMPLAAAEKPNVLLVCVDDLKPLIGCYGDALAKTPNLDRLAARGVRFDRAYCNQAVCSPSRNALLTGYRPQSLGIYDLATNFRKAMPDAVTLPQHFMANGYHTQALGKIFHVGHGNTNDDKSWSVPHFKEKVVAYALKENQAPSREGALFENKNPNKLPRGAAYEKADVPDNVYGDGVVAQETIKRLAAAKGPFFLAVGFVKPHLPFVAPKKYWDLYDASTIKLAEYRDPPAGAPSYAPQFGGELRQYKEVPEKGPLPDDLQRTLIHGYYAAISYMDAQLGLVLDALAKHPQADNTVIVLWGDHGWHLGDHGIWCKHTCYEQAARIPLIVAAPGVKPGVSKAFIETVDIYPTLAELAGLPKPAGDGASFATQLKDVMATGKESIIHVFPRGQRLGRAIRTERHRLVEWKSFGKDDVEYELYDYVSDPNETKNLASEQPKAVEELKAILAKHPAAKPPMKGK